MIRIEIPRSTFYENEDWTTRFKIDTPGGVALVGSTDVLDPDGISIAVYEKSQGSRSADALEAILEATASFDDQVPHPYDTGARADARDIVSDTLRTEGWTRNGDGYNFLYVVERSVLPDAKITAGARFNIVYLVQGAAGRWGDFTLVHEINIASGSLA